MEVIQRATFEYAMPDGWGWAEGGSALALAETFPGTMAVAVAARAVYAQHAGHPPLTLFPTTINGVLRAPKIVQQVEPAENYDDDSSPTSVLSGPSESSSSSLNVGKEYSKKLFDGLFPPATMDTNSKQLRIAVVAPLFESIPPKNRPNGIMPTKERPVEELSAEYVYNLVEMLVKNGQDVTLFASSDSMTSAKLISAYPAMRENRALPGIWNHPYIWMFEQIRQRANEFDIIHFNTIEHLEHMKPYIHKALTTLHAQPGGSTVENELLSQLTAHQQLFNGANVAVRSDQVAKCLKAKKALPFCQFHTIKSYNGSSNQWQQIAFEYMIIYRSISRLNELQNVKTSLLPAVGPSSSIANGSLAEAKNQEQKINCENVFDILNKSKPLRIAIVTPPILDALPPTKGGGTERMVYFLTEQLAQRGNKVTLIAPIGTKVSKAVDLRTIPYKTNPWAGKSNWLHHMLPVLYSQKYVSEHAHEFDILHFHDSDHFVLMRDFVDRVVVTRHLPIDDLTFFNTFNHIPMVSISDEQRKHVPKGSFGLNWIGTVHNGIPLDQLTFRQPHPGTSERPYLAWMGRMAPEKGVDIAIEFALRSGIKLKIAAQLVDEHKHSYWHKQIEPLINANQNLVEYVGEIGGDERDSFLGNALAFLFTPKWDEPFGLSMIEAMATGTPAIANRRGAVPEIVQIGRNGFTFEYNDRLGVEQVANFVHLINQAAQLDRATVRQSVEEKWSLDKMAENYEKVYHRVLNKNFIANCHDN
ncbi:hypothetical protein niasHT_020627 [Heterodera trifolii]|uniref:Glycosyltransferase n=1 Tax=Heterodera trifolii TaxID=157864 RepID=A0ABD2KKY8_9BILA